MRVLCLDPLSQSGFQELKAAGLELVVKHKITNSDLDAAVQEYAAVIVRSANTVRPETFAAGADTLRCVARAGAGVDNIDLAAAKSANILVVNSPTGNSEAVAELTLGLLLARARRIPAGHHGLTQGKWLKTELKGTSISGKTLGIIGYGSIGKAVATRAQAFGMKIIALTRRQGKTQQSKPDQSGVALTTSLDDLLRESDFVTLHVPKTDQTEGMIGAEQLKLMKRSAVIINTARGGVVDESALLEALEADALGGACLDVFSQEGSPVSETVQRLAQHPNVVCTPHLGAATQEAADAVMLQVCTAVAAVLTGGTPDPACLVA